MCHYFFTVQLLQSSESFFLESELVFFFFLSSYTMLYGGELKSSGNVIECKLKSVHQAKIGKLYNSQRI